MKISVGIKAKRIAEQERRVRISDRMRRVRSSNTGPEIALRKALREKGVSYRIAPKNLPGKPDIVIPKRRLAIFIDGDFWHGNQWKKRQLSRLEDQFKKTDSKKYWLNKIRRNIERDIINTEILLSDGWKVIRIWESDVTANLENCLNLVLKVVNNRIKGARKRSVSLLPEKTFADFFAGIGLMRIGLEKQNWNCVFSNDIDPLKYEMYKGHFHDEAGHYFVGDIHSLKMNQIPGVTLATASFPCTDLSLAGGRHGLKGKQSSSFWGFVNILEKMNNRRPPLILLENVTGFITSHKGEDFKDAMLALNKLGYLMDAFIIDAQYFVPQSRQRLFIVGVLDNEEVQKSKWRLLDNHPLRPKILSKFIIEHPQIEWNVRNLPLPNPARIKLENVLEDTPHDSKEWYSPNRAKYLLNQMSERHRKIAEEMINKEDWSYGTVFRRMRKGKSTAELRTDGIAGCLRTPKGGSAKQILFKAGKGQYHVRLLKPIECARLMGAGDYLIKVSNTNQALFGFGDAVCVPVIEWIAKYYLNPIVNELTRGQLLQKAAGV